MLFLVAHKRGWGGGGGKLQAYGVYVCAEEVELPIGGWGGSSG